ncbi:MAG: hypothetical protein VCA55_11925 [Verrucomicrobiales bacterium]
MKPLCGILIVAFASLCAANILAGLAPGNPPATGWLAALRRTAGIEQNWSMFYSIPRVHRLRVRVIAMDPGGKEHEFGPGLPGLEEIHPREKIRYYYTFERMFTPGGESYREPYIRALAHALERKNPQLVEFSVHLEIETTHPQNTRQKISRLLDRIRKDGKLTIEQRSVFGPFPVKNDAAR